MTASALAAVAASPTAPIGGSEPPTPDPAMVEEHLTERVERSPWVELRALNPLRKLPPLSRWFNRETVADAVRWAVAMNGTRRNLYCTINRIDARPPEGQPAEDRHVARRCELLIDCDDPQRPKGTGATDEGRAVVFAAGEACRDYLAGRDFGEPERVVDSGNGLHLDYRLDLPPDDGETVKRLLYALRARWPFVDTSVFNPSRICRVAGTVNWKGEPFRLCRTLERRSGASPVPLTAMQAVIEELTPPASKTETKRKKPAAPPAPRTNTTTPPRTAPAETPAE